MAATRRRTCRKSRARSRAGRSTARAANSCSIRSSTTPVRRRFSARTSPPDGARTKASAVLDLVARHPSTAHFIATKLARHFVSDDPPKALVDRCARHVQQDRRRHPRDGALRRHEPRVLQPSGVSRQGEDAVRGRGQRAARRERDAGSRRRARRSSWRGSASRSSAGRRPMDGRIAATRG